MSLTDSEEIHERASVCNVRLENPEWPDLNRDSHTENSHCSFFYNGGGGNGGPSDQNDQHYSTFARPHLKTINTPSLLHSHISKRSALHHFYTPTSQNDQHSISFVFPHLNASRLLSVHSHVQSQYKENHTRPKAAPLCAPECQHL